MFILEKNTDNNPPKEPTITLINIVFLMLIFFLIAGTLAPPLDPGITLMDLENEQGHEMPDALAILADGALNYRGSPVTDITAYTINAIRPRL